MAVAALGAWQQPAVGVPDRWVDVCGGGAPGAPETLVADLGPQHLVKVKTRVNGGGQLIFATDTAARCLILRDQTLGTRPKPATTTFFVNISSAEWADTCASQLGQVFENSGVEILTDDPIGDPWGDDIGGVQARVAISGTELVIHFLKGVNVHGVGLFELDADSPDCDDTGAHWTGAMVLYDADTPIEP